MSTGISNNRRIAQNTLYLYTRTIVILFVSLYTSRVVLQVLGASDLGIYNVVGGVVVLLSFFQAAQSRATSRFITYELGKNSGEAKLRQVFSACMTIHILLALLSVILAETIGLWILNNLTDIPVERQNTAFWVYQYAIIVFCIHVIRIPYDSVVIAHEKMSMFAYMSILEAIMQLGLVYLIKYIDFDSLFLYSLLLAITAFILFVAYYLYVKIKYSFYRFDFNWDKEFCLKILSFSGWTLLGTGANTFTHQGVNLLMNNYVGLIANAALGFANQVNIAVGKFINGFSTAFTPQIIKLYAQKDYSKLFILINRSSKFSFALCYIIALPLIINMSYILNIWLGDNVPQYTTEFCQLILICTIIDATTGVYNTTITATGKIKKYQIFISLSFLLDLLISFVLLYIGIYPVVVFGSRIVTRGILNMFIGLFFMKKQMGFDVKQYNKSVLLPIVLTIILSVLPIYCIVGVTCETTRFITTSLVGIILVSICVFFVIMDKSERAVLLNRIKKNNGV